MFAAQVLSRTELCRKHGMSHLLQMESQVWRPSADVRRLLESENGKLKKLPETMLDNAGLKGLLV